MSSAPAAVLIPRRLHLVLLTLVIMIGALLRFTALGQGIPFAIGVDEPEIVERAVRMMKTGDLHPHFFDYPGLYIYIQFLTACARFAAGGIAGLWSALDQAAPADFYLWGRAVTAAFGTATIVLVYRGASRLSPLAGLLSAAVFAVQSMHVRESHFVLTDVPTTFFVTLAWVLSLRATEHHTERAFLWAGVAAGLAAATKYNGGVAILLPLLVLIIGPGSWAFRLRAGAAVILGAGGAFVAGAPYTLIALPEFLNKFAYLSHMYAVGTPPVEPGWLTYLKHLRINFSIPGLILATGGLGLAARALWRTPRSASALCWTLTAVFVGIYFEMIAGQRLIYGRYLLPLLPFLSVMAGGTLAVVLGAVLQRLQGDARTRGRALPATRAVAAVALLIVCWIPGAKAVSTVIDARKLGTAEQAYRWIQDNVPAGSRLAIESRGILLDETRHNATNVRRLIDHDFGYYQTQGFDFLIASSQAFATALYSTPPEPGSAAQYRELFQRLEPLITFMPDRTHPGAEWRIYRVPSS